MILLVAVILLALAFDVTNGFHDSANSIAALVATGAARPGAALALAATCHAAGPLLLGTAIADTVGGVVAVRPEQVLTAVTAALVAAITWNLGTLWLGLPSSSSHALVGGLAGASAATAGVSAIHWGGFDQGQVTGVVGVLVGLAVSPLLGFGAALLMGLAARRLLRRARRRVNRLLRGGEWFTAAALAFAHGANDAQKTMGVITLLLVSTGHLALFAVPLWVKLAAAASLTIGTSLGGWRIVRTVGRGIYRLRPLDGLVSQTSSAVVILGGAAVGAPVSTTHVVASSVVGIGAGRRRRHVHWPVVREIASAWVVTLPGTALIAAGFVTVGRCAA